MSSLFVPLLLNRRAGHRPIRAEDAAITLSRVEHGPTRWAGVGQQAGKLRHQMQALIATRRAGHKGMVRYGESHNRTSTVLRLVINRAVT